MPHTAMSDAPADGSREFGGRIEAIDDLADDLSNNLKGRG